jgi:hypothetical protein
VTGVTVGEKNKAYLAFFSQLGQIDPVGEAVFFVAFVFWVAVWVSRVGREGLSARTPIALETFDWRRKPFQRS